MRARNIKPGFFKNEQLAEIEPLGRILYEGLWCMSDREGRLEDRPKKIKAEILPYDQCDVDILLNQLVRYGFISRYEINGQRFIWIMKFSAHQNPHKKEPASVIPPPPETGYKTPGATSEPVSERFGTSLEISGTSPGISGARPADSLIPDSLIPDFRIADLEIADTRNPDTRISGGRIPVPLYPGSLNPGRSNLYSRKFGSGNEEAAAGEKPVRNTSDDGLKTNCTLIARHLRDAILRNKPDATLPPQLDSWTHTARLMIQQDKRSPDRICRVIDWCLKDKFWSLNILSMEKLRKHFDRLELEMKRNKEAANNGRGYKNWGYAANYDYSIANLVVRAEPAGA